MTWVKLDENMTDHPKLVEAGPLAGWLYVCGLSYCNRLTTDGFIPEVVLGRLGAFDLEHDVRGLAVGLCDVGLWEWDDDRSGWWVHNYSEYQPTREEVRAKSEQARSAARTRWGKRPASPDACDPHSDTDADRNAPAMRRTGPYRPEPEEPSPNPPLAAVPDPPPKVPAAPQRPAYEADFEALWKGYPRKVDKADAFKAYQARRRQGISHTRLAVAVGHYAEQRQGHDQSFTKHLASFLAKDGPWVEWVAGPPDGARAGPATPEELIAQHRAREAK